MFSKLLAGSAAFAIAVGLASSAHATLLVAAGGGGGAGYFGPGVDGGAGQATTAGQAGFGAAGGAGGINGSGGGGGTGDGGNYNGGGGGGWLGNGGNGAGAGPTPGQGGSGNGGFGPPTFAGGAGGGQGDGGPATGVTGGFGGGGGGGWQGGGGGGGYSGGGGGDGADFAGGGGGSYIDSSGTVINLLSGVNSDNGTVVIGGVTFSYTGSIESYTIPATGIYDILAEGAQGGGAVDASGGLGAEAQGDFLLNAGTVLDIVVGGEGVNGDFGTHWGGSGGGGSFVYTVSAVPEPASITLLGAALLGLGAVTVRRRRRA